MEVTIGSVLKMKLLVLLGLVALAAAAPFPSEVDVYYHESVGIPEFERLKSAEASTDFDGSRIVGGSAASIGQYPHMAGLIITLLDGRQSVCGASLISNTRCVTAAHCWSDGQNQARQFTVVLGTVHLFSGGHRVVTSNVVMHEHWNPRTIENDVAMITMQWVNYNNNIRNINLPSGSLMNSNFVGHNAQASGYGRQRDGANIANNQQMHHVTLRVISNADCARWFGSSIIASTLCTDGSDRRSTCNGDSGGPLQINNNGPVLIGITSFGSRWGCQIGWPAAFARVTAYANWFRARL